MAHRGIAVAVGLIVATLTVWAQPQHPGFPAPGAQPEVISDTDHFPYLPPPPGARLVGTKTIDGPLELKQATADDEAVLAGVSYIQKTYDAGHRPTAAPFLSTYRDALFVSGWKLVDITRIEDASSAPGTVNVAAHYRDSGRNLYARVSQEPGGAYHISVADVGAEDWKAALARDCRVRIHSIHFDLDRSTIKLYESEPTLQKLAGLLRSRSTPALEIQGHVDNIGETAAAARQALSEGRAKAVAAWLTSHGVPAGKVTSGGYGKTRPIAENDSDLGRALNRRIELARQDCKR